MKSRILFALLIALLAGCEAKSSLPEEFIGHFVSDREATLERWETSQQWGDKTNEMIKSLGPILGITEVITDGTNYTVVSGDWSEEGVTEYLSINGLTAEVSVYSTMLEQETIHRLEADPEGYWIYSGDPIGGYCERFTRKHLLE